MGMTKRWVQKWYSIILPLFPIFILYGFKAIPFMTFADYLLIFFIIAKIVTNRFKLVYNKVFIPLTVYLLVQPLLLFILPSKSIDFMDAAGTAWKLALYIFGISLLAKDLQMQTFVKSIRFVGVASTVYGFFQYFLGTYAHISLSPYLPFLPVLRTGLKAQQDEWIAYNWTVRPRAWFSEPSTFAIYFLAALLVELFLMHKDQRNNKLCALYIIGVIISRSSTGVLGLIIVLFVWLILCPEEFVYKIPKRTVVGFLCLMPFGLYMLYRSGYIDSFIGHTFANGLGLAAQSHFVDVQAAFANRDGILFTLIGNGMQDVEAGYLPGWFRVYYCLGVIGVLLYVLGFYRVFRLLSRRRRVIVLTFLILNVGTEIMLGVYMLLYMSLAMIAEEDG